MEIVHVCFSIVIVTYTVIPCITDGGIHVLGQCCFFFFFLNLMNNI